MTARERVLAAITHQQPDRTPCDFWAEDPTWRRLLEFTALPDREHLLRSLGIDLRHLNAIEPKETSPAEGVYQNMWGERYVYQSTPWGPMREDLPGALSGAQSLSELESFNWPNSDEMDYSRLQSECDSHQDYALLYGFADIWQRPSLVRGWEQMFLDMVERPDWVHFLGRKFTDFYLEDYTRAAECTKGRIDLYLLISDLGTQRGPLISLSMFQQFVAPYLKEMIDRIHHLGGRVLFHSCGAIRPFIPALIQLGVDVLDPIQPVSAQMSPESLKPEFGQQLCFHGGIDIQKILPFGTTEVVKAEARRYCETLGENGGYIMAPAHRFQPDVPPENILALYA